MPKTSWSLRGAAVSLIEVGQDTEVRIDLEHNGSPAAITSATYTLYNASSNAVVNAQAATVSGGTLTYTVSSSDTTSESAGERWREEWAVTFSGAGEGTRRFPRSAAYVKYLPYPVIGQTDLVKRHHFLGNQEYMPANQTSWQDHVDVAWNEIEDRLWEQGKRPWRIISGGQLRRMHTFKALELVFRDLASKLDEDSDYAIKAESYEDKFDKAFDRLTVEYDLDDDGDADEESGAVATILYTSGRGSRYRRRGGY